MSETVNFQPEKKRNPLRPSKDDSLLTYLAKLAIISVLSLIVFLLVLSVARQAIYKIRPYERGLHLRGGRFIGVDMPGWHIRIPFVDTTIGITIGERAGEIEQLSAMTSDDVIMDVSLLYTYRVSDPVQYELEVEDPDRIVAEFVKAKLRDVINTKDMTNVMHSRAAINEELMAALKEKEAQYGVEFVLIQIQNASPPTEVVNAIKDRMVALQHEQQAQAEASQSRTLADSEFYAAQKTTDSDAYQITKIAEADAMRISLTAAAQQKAIQALLDELETRGTLGEDYLQVLIAQELRENSKWIITNGETLPVIDLGATP